MPARIVVIQLMNMLVLCYVVHVLSVLNSVAGHGATRRSRKTLGGIRQVLAAPGFTVVKPQLMNVLVACYIEDVLSVLDEITG